MISHSLKTHHGSVKPSFKYILEIQSALRLQSPKWRTANKFYMMCHPNSWMGQLPQSNRYLS